VRASANPDVVNSLTKLTKMPDESDFVSNVSNVSAPARSRLWTPEHLTLALAVEDARSMLRKILARLDPELQSAVGAAINRLTAGLKARNIKRRINQ
jgi:hypothetical protein